jgi:undecaprenyl-diphosphatase
MSIPPRTASLARTATPWAVAGLVLIAALGAYLRLVHSGPFGVDEWWHGVAGATRGSAPHAVAVFMAEAGSGIGAAACTAIAAALLLALRRPRDAASVATAMVIGIAASETLKALVMRPRPWDPLFHAAGSSYPSGHSMGAAALAVSLALGERVGVGARSGLGRRDDVEPHRPARALAQRHPRRGAARRLRRGALAPALGALGETGIGPAA